MIKLSELKNLLTRVNTILKQEPQYISLPSTKPIAFVGDIHGDIDSLRKVLEKFNKYRLVFLGDYIDRSPVNLGSLEVMVTLMQSKLRDPKRIIMLRGNHEFHPVETELQDDLHAAYNSQDTQGHALKKFGILFSNLPYAASTKGGILALHGGVPEGTFEDLKSVPKGIKDDNKNIIASQIVWNDIALRDDEFTDSAVGIAESPRGIDINHGFIFGDPFFSQQMRKYGKSVLIRGHDPLAKGFSLNDRALTVLTSAGYAEDGEIQGKYVAVLKDPKKQIRKATQLEIVQI